MLPQNNASYHAFVILVSLSGLCSLLEGVTSFTLGSMSASSKLLVNRFDIIQHAMKQPWEEEEDDSEPVMYDDFGDFVIGSSPSSSSSVDSGDQMLSQLVETSRQEEMERESRLSRNWRQGNWIVRGFSLDKESTADFGKMMAARMRGDDLNRAMRNLADENHPVDENDDLQKNAVNVCKVVGSFGNENEDDELETLCVGRTDGSVCLVQLGTDYMTKFINSPKYSLTDDDKLNVESELKAYVDEQDQQVDDNPFQVLYQFQAHDEAITALLYNEDSNLIISAGGTNGEILMWSTMQNDDNYGESKVMPIGSLSNVHVGKIVSLEMLSTTMLLSASADGSFALWHLPTGDLVYSCRIGNVDDTVSINCAHVDTKTEFEPEVEEQMIFFGLSTSHVIGYLVSDVMKLASQGGGQCPMPCCQFMAHDDTIEGGVSAIHCAGKGSTIKNNASGRNTNQKASMILLTGSANGEVKQWEIFARKDSTDWKMEHWPRLSTQRMQGRAHVFAGHEFGPVSSLVYHRDTILSAGADGTIRVWNASKGKELFRMDGFTPNISSLIMDREIVITDGMEDHVCIHDFNIDDEFENEDIDLGDYLGSL